MSFAQMMCWIAEVRIPRYIRCIEGVYGFVSL